MVKKAKPPEEDPETKARREQAERLAEERQVGEIQGDVSRETGELLRRFGNRLAMSGLGTGTGIFSVGGGGGSVPPVPSGRTGGGGGSRGGTTGGGLGGGVQLF